MASCRHKALSCLPVVLAAAALTFHSKLTVALLLQLQATGCLPRIGQPAPGTDLIAVCRHKALSCSPIVLAANAVLLTAH